MKRDDSEMMTIDEVAKRLGIGRNQGYEAAARGDIPSIRIGKRILVPKAAFERMVAESGNRVQAAQAEQSERAKRRREAKIAALKAKLADLEAAE